jgi:hypothetical protein
VTFLEYCRLQRERGDPVGDFARDWCADRERPRAPLSLSNVVAYLEDQGAIEPAIRAGIRAYNEWRLFAARSR